MDLLYGGSGSSSSSSSSGGGGNVGCWWRKEEGERWGDGGIYGLWGIPTSKQVSLCVA